MFSYLLITWVLFTMARLGTVGVIIFFIKMLGKIMHHDQARLEAFFHKIGNKGLLRIVLLCEMVSVMIILLGSHFIYGWMNFANVDRLVLVLGALLLLNMIYKFYAKHDELQKLLKQRL